MPGETGELTVNGDLSMGSAHIRTRASTLTIQPANESSLRLVTQGNSTASITSPRTDISAHATVGGTLDVSQDTRLRSSLQVDKNARVKGDGTVEGGLSVSKMLSVGQDVTVNGGVDVAQASKFRDLVTIKKVRAAVTQPHARARTRVGPSLRAPRISRRRSLTARFPLLFSFFVLAAGGGRGLGGARPLRHWWLTQAQAGHQLAHHYQHAAL